MERAASRSAQYNREYSNRRNPYIDGNTARKLQDNRAARRREREYDYNRRIVREVPGSARKGIKRTTTINAGYVLFLSVAMCIAGYFCVNYLTITSEMSNDLKKIAQLEIQYNDIKAENDDYDNRINGAVDLEDIKRRAMNDLGMQYANDDQIVAYESDDTDYVRQYIALE